MNNSEQNPQSCQTDASDSRFQSAYAEYWDRVKDIIDNLKIRFKSFTGEELENVSDDVED